MWRVKADAGMAGRGGERVDAASLIALSQSLPPSLICTLCAGLLPAHHPNLHLLVASRCDHLPFHDNALTVAVN